MLARRKVVSSLHVMVTIASLILAVTIQCRLEKSAELPWCKDHACQMPGCRVHVPVSRSTCDFHTCRDCSLPGLGGGACKKHKCNKAGCLSSKVQAYCSAHACVACNDETSDPGSRLCNNHVCSLPGCLGARNPDGMFCGSHECRKMPGCTLPRATWSGLFCILHECKAEGCLMWREKDSYCRLHT